MARFLPKTRTPSLLFVILALCGILLYLFTSAIVSRNFFRVGFALIIFAPLGVGLWLQFNFSRAILAGATLFLAILLPVGLINPFAASDYFPRSPPDVWDLALDVYPWTVVGLIVVHVLEKYKSQFKPLFLGK
jgi:hypothetical protein